MDTATQSFGQRAARELHLAIGSTRAALGNHRCPECRTSYLKGDLLDSLYRLLEVADDAADELHRLTQPQQGGPA